MPLLKRARIEIYLPERGRNNYARMRRLFEREFLNTFGGCTVINNIKGLYLSSDDNVDEEKISLIYSDTPFDFDEHLDEISKYADELRATALEALNEESILIVVHGIYHLI